MKNPLRFFTIASVTAVLALTLAACGHHRHHDPEEKAEWISKKISRKLDLNEDQQAKLKELSDVLVDHHKQRKDKRKEHMNALMEQVTQPALDTAMIQGIFDEHHASMAELAPQVIGKLAIFHASLDDKQKQKLAKKLEKFKRYHHDEDED